nr:hypothetical protein [Tanacetum cinerariifolium]
MTIDTNVTDPVNMAIEDVLLSHYFEPYVVLKGDCTLGGTSYGRMVKWTLSITCTARPRLPKNYGVIRTQSRHRAANYKMPKRMNPHKANMVNDNMDMIAMVSDIISMISEVNLVDSNNSG